MQNQIIGFFIISTVSLGILCAVQWQKTERYQARVVALREELAQESLKTANQNLALGAVERDRERLEKNVSKLTQVTQELQDVTNRLSDAFKQARRQTAALMFTSPGLESGNPWMAILQSPEMKESLQIQQRRVILAWYGDLFPKLDLNPSEQRKFEELLLEKHAIGFRDGKVALAGVPGESTNAFQFLASMPSVSEKAIQELIGERNFSVYQEYQQSLADRIALQPFRARLDETQYPLLDQQFAKLLMIIQQERSRASGGTVPNPNKVQTIELAKEERQPEELVIGNSWPAKVLQRTREFLSAEQHLALAEFLADYPKGEGAGPLANP